MVKHLFLAISTHAMSCGDVAESLSGLQWKRTGEISPKRSGRTKGSPNALTRFLMLTSRLLPQSVRELTLLGTRKSWARLFDC